MITALEVQQSGVGGVRIPGFWQALQQPGSRTQMGASDNRGTAVLGVLILTESYFLYQGSLILNLYETPEP